MAKVGSKFYWYGSGGEILAETDTGGNIQNEYVYFGGRRVAALPSSGTPLYYGQDMLGTSRVMVESNGTLCYDADFTPFGTERPYTSTCSSNYKFEGKERDTETGNDDFGARNYSWRYGRWLSADWSSVPVPVPYANLTNPQSLNLYSMVSDDPESFADLDGHQDTTPAWEHSDGQINTCTGSGGPADCSVVVPQTDSTGTLAAAQEKKDQDTQRVGNIVHNETGGLRPETKDGSGSSKDLHESKVAVADVVENREKAGNNGGVASDQVSSKERNTPQYKDAQQAAAEAARSPDVTGGSKHFYLDYGQGQPKWAVGKETTSYGPFTNVAGGGDVPKGADVKIIIVHPENQQ